MTASRTLAALTEKGLLVRYSPGRPGKVGNRRAAIYGLVDPDTFQHHRTESPVSPPSQSPVSRACQSPWPATDT